MTLSPSASPCGSHADDAQLLTAVADGDSAALRALHDRYSSPARAVARRVLVDDNLAQDVVQDVFVTLCSIPTATTRPAARSEPGCSASPTTGPSKALPGELAGWRRFGMVRRRLPAHLPTGHHDVPARRGQGLVDVHEQ